MTTNFELTSTNAYLPSSNLLSASTLARPRATVSAETTHPAANLGQDTAALSATSLSAPAGDDSRAAHIAAIGQSIAAGTYFVPSYDVASSIIDSLF